MKISKQEHAELTAKAKERDELWDKYLRLHADYDNAKKVWDKQKSDLLKFGNFRILKEFVTVLDEIEAAFTSLGEEHKDKDHTAGLKMTRRQLDGLTCAHEKD